MACVLTGGETDAHARLGRKRKRSTRRSRRASKRVACYNRPAPPKERPDVPTDRPPPYFPQNPLSPGDEKTARRMRLTFIGCLVLLALGVLGVIVGLVYLVRSLL
jgi:hypothetical protein